MTNGSKSWSPTASAGPGPESMTSNLARSAASLCKRTTTFGGGPPGRLAASMAFSSRLTRTCRSDSASPWTASGSAVASKRRSTFACAAAGPTRASGVAHQRLQLDPLRGQRRRTPEGEKPLQVGFHQTQLADGHFQGRLVLPAGTLPLVQFDGHPRPGRRIAELMGHAGAKLPERPQAFVAADRLLVAAERLRHAVDREREVADLVVAAGDGQRLELPLGDRRRLPSEFLDGANETPRQDGGDRDDGQSRRRPGPQRRIDRLPRGAPPLVLRIEHHQPIGPHGRASPRDRHPPGQVGPSRDDRRLVGFFRFLHWVALASPVLFAAALSVRGLAEPAPPDAWGRTAIPDGPPNIGLLPSGRRRSDSNSSAASGKVCSRRRLSASKTTNSRPRQPAHLPQHLLRQGESGVGQGGDDAGKVVLLPAIGPVHAQVGDRPAGQQNGKQDDGKEREEELDLDGPPHSLILSSLGGRRQSDGGRASAGGTGSASVVCHGPVGTTLGKRGNTGEASATQPPCRGV